MSVLTFSRRLTASLCILAMLADVRLVDQGGGEIPECCGTALLPHFDQPPGGRSAGGGQVPLGVAVGFDRAGDVMLMLAGGSVEPGE